MIPKRLHQIWVGPRKAPLKLINTFKEHYSNKDGWSYFLWTNELVESLDLINKDLYNEAIDRKEYALASDILRFEILYKYGGVYMDADSISLKRIDDHMLEDDMFSCFENEITRPVLIASAHLGSIIKNDSIKLMIDGIKERGLKIFDEPGWITTGPMYFTKQVLEHRLKIKIYPSYYFIPTHYTGAQYRDGQEIVSYSEGLFLNTRESILGSDDYGEYVE